MKRKRFDIKGFAEWLTACGAVVEPPTNPWELIRARTVRGTLVAHFNKKGEQTWPTELAEMRDAYMSGQAMWLNPELKGTAKVRAQMEGLADRDGMECWFCGMGFTDINDRLLSIEHLLARSHGGSDHPSNLVLSCKFCNETVGNLYVAAKVAYRETRRSAAPIEAFERAAS